MKAFGFLGLLLILISCGDEDTSPKRIVETKLVYPSVPLWQPPPNEFFAPFKDTLTNEEFEHLLLHTKAFCESEHLTPSVLLVRLSWGLSDESLERVFSKADDIELEQAAHFSLEHRISVAAWFKYQGNYRTLHEIHFEGDYVIYQLSELYGIYTMYINEDGVTRGWSGSVARSETFVNSIPYELPIDIIDFEDDLIPEDVRMAYEHIYHSFMGEGKINIPKDADIEKLGYYFVIFDPNGVPLLPIPENLVMHVSQAPKANNAEIALYNRIHTPNAYDCSEEN